MFVEQLKDKVKRVVKWHEKGVQDVKAGAFRAAGNMNAMQEHEHHHLYK